MKWICHADKDAILCGDRRISYDDLLGLTVHAGALMRPHCNPGDHIAILASNSPEWAIALYGAWHIGAVVVPIDFMSTPEEIAFILSDCTPAVVWSDAGSRGKLMQAISLSGCSPTVMMLDSLAKVESHPVSRDEGIGESPDERLALIVYTSGTTGNPKGVMLTFGNIHANTDSCSKDVEVFIPEDRVLVVLPLHHAYPLMGSLVMPISIGGTAVFATEMNADAILGALQQHQCTFIIGVPRLLELFRNAIMRKVNSSFIARMVYKLSVACHSVKFSRLLFSKVQKTFGGHIRYIACGGAAAAPEVIRDFYALGFELLEGYGMTETAPMISFTPPGRVKLGSPGKPIPCNEISIKDGEVCVRGKNVTQGYYNRPEETREALDADGWLHTGDLGYVDEDGYIFLTGRTKELIILGNGKNINPAELEKTLMEEYSHGLLSEVAVADNGKCLVAVAVPDMKEISSQGIVNIEKTIQDRVLEPYNEHAPSYKRIAALELRSQPLPRTRLGKIRRHILQKEMQGGSSAEGAQSSEPKPDTREYALLEESLEKLAGRAIRPDEHFELDLGLDSLAKLTLLSTLGKEHGIWVQVDELVKHPTPRELAVRIAEIKEEQKNESDAAAPAEEKLPKTGCTHRLLRAIGSFFLRMISRVRTDGRENIPEGPCVFAPNHQSFLDGFFIGATMTGRQFSQTFFYADAKFISGWFLKRFARHHNLIPMEINGDLRKSIGLLERLLKSGKSVAIFPEGTRSLDGSLGSFYPTFAQLAIDAGVPIIPVAIKGAIDILPRGKSFPKLFRRVQVSYLKPIAADGGATAEELSRKTREEIAAALK